MDMEPERTTLDLSHETAAKGLEEDQDVDGDANAVVRIGQVARGTDGDETEDEDDGRKADSNDVEVRMVLDGLARTLGVETDKQGGDGYYKEEGDGGQHAVAEDETVVLCEGRKAVSHSWRERCH